ncbi:MAG: hypothetical protein WBW84_20865 [Acidobacteriaceae bacterium]
MCAFAVPKIQLRWQSMDVERYAALERATGVKVIEAGGVCWHQVRPLFYRPLLPYQQRETVRMTKALRRFGAFQYAVASGEPSNSYLNPIVFEEPGNYDVPQLRYSVQKHIRKAVRNELVVSRIEDEREFFEFAYPCYLSFYERTKYAFASSRTRKDVFLQWSRDLFRFPETMILGAFLGKELISFEIACLVEDTLILKALVNSDKALRLGAADLLLHTYRASVSDEPRIVRIYDSLLGQQPGINDFYLVRGARALALPARLRIPSALLWILGKTNQELWKKFMGLSEEELASSSVSGSSGE